MIRLCQLDYEDEESDDEEGVEEEEEEESFHEALEKLDLDEKPKLIVA